MLTVLLLAAAEKLINIAIGSDEITQAGLASLAGKVLRLNIATPKIQVDVLFNHEHLRFEPVTTDEGFESRAHVVDNHAIDRIAVDSSNDERQQANVDMACMSYSRPDCTLNVENIAQLLHLMRGADGDLPMTGDDKVQMQLQQLVAGFDPDIAGQLEPLIGKPLASQLQLVISQLKRSFGHRAKSY
ncbi:hypothetical protein [Psychrobacter urativorans]|uniref:SCP2 domain-containing protein n=1 Tax=Psychrobacter urativorans TaxID=45610 RepID=A0A0M4TU69_9GAMM|nr:hypothetical protein [Psychrobacter urativorans]ALF59111.1 hypothetical protein AOC03_02825 [Psychrobacter urativorans]